MFTILSLHSAKPFTNTFNGARPRSAISIGLQSPAPEAALQYRRILNSIFIRHRSRPFVSESRELRWQGWSHRPSWQI